jgi:hypothetical protein
MRASHENHSVLFGLKIICEDRTINLSSAATKIPCKLRTQAIHIIVGAKQAADARDRCNWVFGSRKEGGHPQGMKLRFMPDVADTRFPVTPNTRMKAVKMMSKQKAFLDNAKVVHADTIAGLHAAIDKIGGFSLCQILMATRLSDDKEMGLFITIDEQHLDGSHTTAFTVHNTDTKKLSASSPCSASSTKQSLGSPPANGLLRNLKQWTSNTSGMQWKDKSFHGSQKTTKLDWVDGSS